MVHNFKEKSIAMVVSRIIQRGQWKDIHKIFYNNQIAKKGGRQ
jgi:hypothetical protein